MGWVIRSFHIGWTGSLSLSKRGNRNDVIMMFKILTRRVALNINDFFTITPSRTSTRKLISQGSAPKTVLRSKFFSKRVLVAFWKLLKENIVCLSLNSFESFLENRLNDL
ncbi:hypothetical protein Y032_0397g704 [Ancylostoma ceylanicum]|uniref:Uncharacterized protein n=1 Tax=Ancylostoma ceylanicum TaxID=53326 RepID=A0A016RR85_9BILA|nr:hypothetical protein Y032_0397g704 [Ancylostoma ceylanicum]